MKSYFDYVLAVSDLFESASRLGRLRQPPRNREVAPVAPRVLLFSPHPDDEIVTGALPLRLLRQCGLRIINVPVTLGSDSSRSEQRTAEMRDSSAFLGFDLRLTGGGGGLSRISMETRANDPVHWHRSVEEIAGIINELEPRVIFLPHATDHHTTHIGTHQLVVDALRELGPRFFCICVETEYWATMVTPNLLVESTVEDVAELVHALSLHIGEINRNPFHLSLPAWLMDNVRRGSELIGGPGSFAQPFRFGTLYRLRLWRQYELKPPPTLDHYLDASESPAELLTEERLAV